MKFNFKHIVTGMLLLISSHFVNGQFLSASDTSENSVRRYKSIISSNKEIVEFIEYSLSQKGLPRHLRNLALIESGFDRKQISGAGAVGVWQFMTAHANQYGLSEQSRSDLYRSTKTAVISLGKLYKKYNNWVTVVAAYNCGEGNISRAMDAAGSSQYHIFSKYLPGETINHVKKYLNACYATGELQSVLNDYNNSRMNMIFENRTGQYTAPNLAETDINAGFDLSIIAEELDVDVDKILTWNPGIMDELKQSGESIFYLPVDLMPDFLLKKNKILSRSVRKK
ncbi:lytic transglycosylase domain-containing protein [Chryseobacterium sp. PTM-20240506]|uniref:lytic transglycosylase domain-containing protein n=1 Tax=unclassified Chryseobacterium TaxID=2593645 RepID=UPI001556811A|nr:MULTISPECIES: lytic transglycosylase domain-containing protein [unclassified Chryseobacterium]MDC8106930.1 lytic transglycosylase domain-containing protein [Chryseobacterium sp. B21-037]MDQ1805789.1 lytic transglycosylase domain-containing protein [Chryseobacterium sp. CKR4-1]